ncbi:MAG TPA: hypothetical protein VHC49_16060 [Mycobacteriales bacterium]|nr:hypothetical protein [Mycobacteriales bacterium]
MTSGNEPIAEPRPQIRSLRAHLAGVEQAETGTTLWLSDERTTMHFPLTPRTVPALLNQLSEVDADLRRPFDEDGEPPSPPESDDFAEDRAEPETTGRLSRWTGWHYSNSLVSRIPAKQRIALFAAVLVILLLITLFTR